MKQDKMYVIEKLFQDKKIRTVWDRKYEKYYISVIDIVEAITKSPRARKYWSDLKKELSEEGFEVSDKIGQLKLKAQDGKYRLTDVTDIEGMFRIIESIPSKNAEPVKQWLAHLGSERIDEIFDPSLAIKRAVDLYRTKGNDDDWITKRIRAIQDRKQLIDVWRENGVETNIEYAILTNEIYKSWSGMTSKEYKEYKGLKKESLRDNMDSIELILTDLGEEATKLIAKKQQPQGLKENIKVAKKGGNIAASTRMQLESELGEDIVSHNNKLNYEYVDEKLLKDVLK